MDKPARAGCCSDHDSESGCRNNYFDGKRLTTDSFRVEQRYLLDRRRLLNRAMLGSGVVQGFAVSVVSGRLKIGAGLALDECGRELLQAGPRQLDVDELLLLDDQGVTNRQSAIFTDGQSVDDERRCWLLSVHYAEVSTGPVQVEDSCHCQHTEYERTCETVRYSLRPIPCGDCCREPDCTLECDCGSGPCCGEHTEPGPRKRGGCGCLCEHVTGLTPDKDDCCALAELDDPCGRVRADLKHGVAIACLEMTQDAHGCPVLGEEVDACGPRRVVKSTDLLFDLIRGCDLTRIDDFGWKDWHRSDDAVDFNEFSAALGGDHDDYETVTNRFWVQFSRPVREETVRADCFAMTVMSAEREGGWWQVFRVPIVGVRTERGADDPAGHVSRARVVVESAWLADAVRGRRSLFMGSDTWIEIEVRGDFIVDCNGQTVDANAIGRSRGPTGNGTSGGSFLSTFRVGAVHSYGNSDRVKGASS